MINPDEIPVFTGNVETLRSAAASLKTTGGQITSTGASVHNTWQELSGFYRAPEAAQLFGATAPVRDRARAFGEEVVKVGIALATYADEVEPIAKKLKQLKTDAVNLKRELDQDEDWREDEDKVNRHNNLLTSIDAQVLALQAAERKAANAINALFGGIQWHAGTDPNDKSTYGPPEIPSNAERPWGTPEEVDKPWYVDVWNGTVGLVKGIFVDGLWGDLKGLGSLVGLCGWDEFKKAWGGLGNLVGLGGWEAFKNSWKEFGKSFLAWDMWSEDPMRALGTVVWNVASTVGTAGIFAVAKALGKGGKVAKAAAAAEDAVKATKAAALSKLGDLSKLGLNKLGLGKLPDGSVPKVPDLPDVDVTVPELKVPDGPPGGKVPDSLDKPLSREEQVTFDEMVVRLKKDYPDLEVNANAHKGEFEVDGHTPDLDPSQVRQPDLAMAGGRDRFDVTNSVSDSTKPLDTPTGGQHIETPSHSGSHSIDGGGNLPPDGHLPDGSGDKGPSEGLESPHDETPDTDLSEDKIPDSDTTSGGDNTADADTTSGGNKVPDGEQTPDQPLKDPELAQQTQSKIKDLIRENKWGGRFKDADVEKIIKSLERDPRGTKIAEQITSGRFDRIKGLDELLLQAKQNTKTTNMLPAVSMALDKADSLMYGGTPVDRIVFEKKVGTADIDVGVLKDGYRYTDENPHFTDAYQLKYITGGPGKVWDNFTKAQKQLKNALADTKHINLDVASMSWKEEFEGSRYVREIEQEMKDLAQEGFTFEARFNDGHVWKLP